jgi:DNA-binding beta-propeller fold protein YncE
MHHENLRRRRTSRAISAAATLAASMCLAAPALAGGTLYYADIFNPDPTYGSIKKVNSDGTGLVPLIDVGGGLRGIDVDVAGGKIYWTDVNNFAIRRANLDGSNPEDLITSGLEFPMNIAVHAASGKFYWGDISAGYIGIANLDGSSPEVLINTNFHWGLAIDETGGKLYWSTSDTQFKGRILRANLDGSSVEIIVSNLETEFKPAHVALDVAGGKIYWTDYVVDIVQRSNLDGSNIEPLFVVGGNFNPRGIVVDPAAGKVYFGQDTDFKLPLGAIIRMNLDGSLPEYVETNLGLVNYLVLRPEATPCAPDVAPPGGNGIVNVEDLVAVVLAWGECPIPCSADVDGSGTVDVQDLVVVILAWGPCP